nr:DUF4339 domain-containing protein [bacterium]
MADQLWFYADSNKQQQGPLPFDEIRRLAESGVIQPSTLIWKEGMTDWTAASEIQGVFQNPVTQTTGPPIQITEIPGNPYEAPSSTNLMGASKGGIYPIPHVKKCSFSLFLGLFILGTILSIVGVSLIIAEVSELSGSYENGTDQPEQLNPDDDAQGETPSPEEMASSINAAIIPGVGLLIGLIIITIAMILSYIFVYRAWYILQPGGARTSPGKAVGFMFIPLFNIYWMFVSFHGWAQDWNRIRNSHSNLTSIPPVSEGLFLAGPICIVVSIVPLIGVLASLVYMVIFFVMLFNICKVVNAMADASQQEN